jgi:hypothetical protein
MVFIILFEANFSAASNDSTSNKSRDLVSRKSLCNEKLIELFPQSSFETLYGIYLTCVLSFIGGDIDNYFLNPEIKSIWIIPFMSVTVYTSLLFMYFLIYSLKKPIYKKTKQDFYAKKAINYEFLNILINRL